MKPGKVRDGFNLTGSNGMSANPTNATQTKATINVKAEALGDFTISNIKYIDNQLVTVSKVQMICKCKYKTI
ncbi:hypothetical protein ABHZ92_28785 [Bacteroides ovatus]